MMCLGVNSTQNLHHTLKRTQCPADAAEPSYCPTGQTLWLGLQPWTSAATKQVPLASQWCLRFSRTFSILTSFNVSPEGGRNHDCHLIDGKIEPRRYGSRRLAGRAKSGVWGCKRAQTWNPFIPAVCELGRGNSTHSNKGKSLAAAQAPCPQS